MPQQLFADLMGQVVALEEQVKAAVEQDGGELRVYEWRPSKLPELPAIWNWIDDGSYEIADTARARDLLIVTTTIGVKPSDMTESSGQLMQLTDTFRGVVDPALNENHPLGNTARYAKRVVTRQSFEEFDRVPVMCMDMLIRCELEVQIA